MKRVRKLFQNLAGRTPGYIDEEQYGKYAVIVPFLPETGELLFQVRSEKLNRQPGEICFPGGHIEKGETPLEAGVREAMEELLIPRQSIAVTAPLDILVTSYYSIVYPYLASLTGYAGTFNRDEVREVFAVPFDFFLRNEPAVYYNQTAIVPGDNFPYGLLGIESYPWGRARYPVLFYQYEDRVIWGMTAKFAYNLAGIFRESAGMSEKRE